MEKNNQSSWTRWFRGEVAAAFLVGSSVAGVIMYFNNPINELKTTTAVIQNQIAELKANDLTHIELEQTATRAKLDSQNQQIIDMNNKLTQIITIMQQQDNYKQLQ